jgi:hypothetical protein
MGTAKMVFPPGCQKIAVGIKYHHGTLTPVEDVQPVLTVNRNAADIEKGLSLGELRPPVNQFILILVNAVSHVFPPCTIMNV